MERTQQMELTVLCMIYKENKILLQNRLKKDWKGYTLPGGHIEDGESMVEAVIREMKEETGLKINNPILCGIKHFPIEGGRYLVILYKTDSFEGDVISSSEGKMEWIDRDDLDKLQLVDDFKELLKVIDDDKLSEMQYIKEGKEWKVKLS